ncbi:MAG: DUF1003 domain-containing protein [Candidatus Moraniibacteriota bacterium]
MKTKISKNVQEIRVGHAHRLGKLDRLALFITNKVGTMGFFFLIFSWTVLWLGWNIIGPVNMRFDPYPGFILWLFISNMLQIFLMPLLLIGQNLQGKAADKRMEYDFEVDQKSEKVIEEILAHLQKQEVVLQEITKVINKK